MAVVPKRSDQLIRRNTPEVPITKVTAIGDVKIPTLGIKTPHPMVRGLYKSLKDSAQARFYEPSDWQYAKITLHFLDKLLKADHPSGMMLSTVHSMMTSLLLTEGERRRVRMEVERKQATPEGKVLQVADMFKERLGR